MYSRNIEEWLGKDRRKIDVALQIMGTEKREPLINYNEDAEDYGFSFPVLDGVKFSSLNDIRANFEKTGVRIVVADVGSGLGVLTWKLLSAGAEVDAIDIQKPLARELHKRLCSYDKVLWDGVPLREILHIYAGDVLKLFAKETFNNKYDVIWLSQVIHFMTPEQIALLRSYFSRVLKPGGKVFIQANHTKQLEAWDPGNYIQSSYEDAILNGIETPGFMAINAVHLLDLTEGQQKITRVCSAYNLKQMSVNGIPVVVNTTGTGLIGSLTNKEVEEQLIEYINPEHQYSIDLFHTVIHLFEPTIIKNLFQQDDFEVEAFNFDVKKGKKIPERAAFPIASTVVGLLQKKTLSAEDEYSTIPKSPLYIVRLSRMFEPNLIDKIMHYIDVIDNKRAKQLLMKAYEESDWSLLLRRACAGGQLQVVKLLLSDKDYFVIDINKESSNGNTALDWAYKLKASASRDALIDLLLRNGAQSHFDYVDNDREALVNGACY